MNKSRLSLLTGLLVSLISHRDVHSATTSIQNASDIIGTGTNAWSYLKVEGEDYASELDESEGVGFTRVSSNGALTNFFGNPILGGDTTASKKGALYIQPAAKHGDKATYQVQFATPGTYYLYMRFSMFETGTGETSYLNEDSFFVPPDFGKDPQNDWPLMDAGGQNGGYVEGCCDGAGYLFIPEKGGEGVRLNHSGETNYWEGQFHWNDLLSSQFLNPETQGEGRVRFKYEVTTNQVGKPLTWTISNRETGTAIDLFLFSTHPDLLNTYSQDELDQLLLAPAAGKVTVQTASDIIGTGTNAWSYLKVEGEDYASELDESEGVGFTRVSSNGALTNFFGNPILGADTTASKKGALYIQPAAKHGDKATYQVQFATPGTYYLYMRFSMFETGTGETSYLNEDSFFVPPDFGKDPQNDWPLMDAGGQNGGYVEGCCDGAGYLFIPEKGGEGVRLNHSGETNYWEGQFHWNDLLSSQFLNPETQGEGRVRFKYEVTTNQVGKPLTWTISNRETGTAIDLFLFSTHPDLLNTYSQDELDQLLLGTAQPSGQNLSVSRTGKNIVLSWPVAATGFVLESATTLTNPTWTTVTPAPVVIGDQNSTTIDASSGTAFYRLRKAQAGGGLLR